MFRSEEEKLQNQKIEIHLLLESIFLKYGYDFRNYSRKHIERRILYRLKRSNIASVSEMQFKILNEPNFFHLLLLDFSLNVTEMYRDPDSFVCIREQIVPLLRTYPYIKIWHAGCSTGEEVYSMAILLKEENLLDKTIIYATDFNQAVLKQAAEAIYPVEKIREYTHNYHKAKGKKSFSDYFTVNYGAAKLKDELTNNIVFSDHNLVCDGVFGEMNLIVCRNVLIYFNRELQDKAIRLFYESLVNGGYLSIGPKESITLSSFKKNFLEVCPKIYKKTY